jgi:hypothetical protein
MRRETHAACGGAISGKSSMLFRRSLCGGKGDGRVVTLVMGLTCRVSPPVFDVSIKPWCCLCPSNVEADSVELIANLLLNLL